MAQQNNKPRPVISWRSGCIEASIWRHEFQHNGQTRIRHSTRIEKSYRKKDGSYARTNQYFPYELSRLIVLAQHCHDYIVLSQNKEPE